MSVIGLRVGPYEIVESADVPESGDWFLAQRTAHNRKQPGYVLVRLMSPDADESERASLQNYFERLRKLEDTRIPKAIGYFEGIGAVAIECVRGIHLEMLLDLLADNSIEVGPATALDIVIELSEAVNHAHNRGLVHGALSLDDLVIGNSGQLWVFGIGLGAEKPLPGSWVAPERVAGDPPTVLTDQWSIAAIATALVTGNAPWRQKFPPSASDTSHLVDELSLEWPGLARVLKPMLESNPAHRYESLQKARQELLSLSRQSSTRADRRDLAQRLHLLFQEPNTFEDISLAPNVLPEAPVLPTMPLDDHELMVPSISSTSGTKVGQTNRTTLDVNKLVDQAIQMVEEDFLDALYDSENDTGDFELDAPSSPGIPQPIAEHLHSDPTHSATPGAVRQERNTLSDEIESFSQDTVVPASEPNEFDIGQIANVSFTNPGGVPLIGDPAVAEPIDFENEPSLPTMEMDSPLLETTLPPRQTSPIVKIAPWLMGVAVIGMLLAYFLR